MKKTNPQIRFIKKISKKVTIAAICSMILLSMLSINVKAAGFYLISSANQVNVGQSFTVSINGDVAGRFDASVSNGRLNTSSIFIDSVGSGGSFTVTPTGSGTTYVTVTATDATNSSYQAVTGSQGISVTVVAPNHNTNANTNTNTNTNENTMTNNTDIENDSNKINEDSEQNENDIELLTNKNNNVETITYSSKKYGKIALVKSLDSAPILDNFEKKKITIKSLKTEIEAYQHLESKEYVIYGKVEKDDSAESIYYLYDDKNDKIISSYRQSAILGNIYGIVDDLNTLTNCEKITNSKSVFKETPFTIDGVEYKGFAFKDKNYKNYHLILLKNQKGELKIYQYEKTSHTLQPYQFYIYQKDRTLHDLLNPQTLHLDIVDFVFLGALGLVLAILILVIIVILIKHRNRKKKNSKNDRKKYYNTEEGPILPIKNVDNKSDSDESLETPIIDNEENIPLTELVDKADVEKTIVLTKNTLSDNLSNETYQDVCRIDNKKNVIVQENKEIDKEITNTIIEGINQEEPEELDDIIESISKKVKNINTEYGPVNDESLDEELIREDKTSLSHTNTIELLNNRIEEAQKVYTGKRHEIPEAKPTDYNLQDADKIEKTSFLSRRKKNKAQNEALSKGIDINEFKDKYLKTTDNSYKQKNAELLNTVFTTKDKKEREDLAQRFVKENRKIVYFVANQIYKQFPDYQINELVKHGMNGYQSVLDNLNENTADSFLLDTIVAVSKEITDYILETPTKTQ